MTHIESLTESDREDWLPLWLAYLEFYESVLSARDSALAFSRLTDPRHALRGAIARDAEGRAVGIVHWVIHPTTWSAETSCYLEDLFVDPDARARGVGRALIEHVAAIARADGAGGVHWLTQRENRRARSLYDTIAVDTGFVHYEMEIGRRPGGDTT